MTKPIAVDLGPVQQTLLIPLLGRAEQTRRAQGLIHDPKAVKIVESLDYDFDKWRGNPSLLGASLRTRMLDEEVEAFLALHPSGTVVEIGCGLNTRFDRVDNGTVRWVDLDLPDTIALRRRLFEDKERCSVLSTSVLDFDWMDEVARMGGPWCFISEAALIYLEEPQVRQVVAGLAERFAGAWFITDTVSRTMVDNQHRHDAMRHLPKDSWFRWVCDDPRSLEGWGPGIHLDRSRTFLDASPQLQRRLPWGMRTFLKYAPRFMTRGLRGYRLNRLVLLPPEPLAEEGGDSTGERLGE
ncbi:MAG: class I SAM-dependent methyltransferase [Deltaproteobacteria bacterium]|nr:class I SAM-dependent methyltransferase [Deltaproteobacteria bacterium]